MSFNPEQVNKDKDINYQEVLQQIKPDEGDFKSVELTEEEDQKLLSILKKARKAENDGDFKKAIELYQEYINQFSKIKEEKEEEKKEKEELEPTEQDKEIWKEIKNGNFDNIKKLTTLSREAAKILGEFHLDFLELDSLQELTDQQAKHLAGFQGVGLYLNGLQKLTTDQQAEYLAGFEGGTLVLNGLQELTDQQAKHLAGFQGVMLSLDGLQELTDQQAEHLANYKGIDLCINKDLKEKINKYR